MTPPAREPMRNQAALARDAALARVGHARRWVILGSAGLSAGFAWLVSTSPPSHASATTKTGKTTAPAPARTRSLTRAGTAPALPPLPNGSQLGLAGPSQSPGAGDSQAPAPQVDPNQQQAQSAPAPQPAAPSPQPGPVSGGS